VRIATRSIKTLLGCFALDVWLRVGDERPLPVEENFLSVLFQLTVSPRGRQVIVEEGPVEVQATVHAARIAERRNEVRLDASHTCPVGTRGALYGCACLCREGIATYGAVSSGNRIGRHFLIFRCLARSNSGVNARPARLCGGFDVSSHRPIRIR